LDKTVKLNQIEPNFSSPVLKRLKKHYHETRQITALNHKRSDLAF